MFFNRNDDKKDPTGRRARLLPLLPLRDIIVFPHMVVPLFVGREKSINALGEAMSKDKEILLSAQKKAKTNDPTPDDIFTVGTIGAIIQLLRLPDGTVKVLVEGKRRARVRRYIPSDEFFLCEVDELREAGEQSQELEALMRTIRMTFEAYVKLNKRIPPEMLASVSAIDEAPRLADTIAAHLSLKLNDKQQILETEDPKTRLEKLYELMQAEIEILQVEKKIRSRVKKQMEKTQKEYYLNEQMQAIQKELGERDEFKNEIEELEAKIEKKRMSKEATVKVKKELRKLKMMSPMSAEATVVRNYIDWILSLPWFDLTQDKMDIVEAEKILNDDHYGLKKPKERIVEYLAVQALVRQLKGPILCFVGPPGVGKTSIARSIARATGRKFVRISLGGVRDEAEIRGHRRTYIGALPGKIIQSVKKAGSNNPVFLLDEVDKMSMDFRGDPSSALLEVLDPEQNSVFNDHYLDLDYDLSKVMFIATANNLHSIPIPLNDRMEIIEIAGYTEFEKLNIARVYLIPKQGEANGIENVDVRFTDSAIRTIVNHYTMEAGVRSLEREISAVSRKIACDVVKNGKEQTFKVTSKMVPKFLGPYKHKQKQVEERDEIGMTNGLAVTMFGGTMLKNEVGIMPGKGKLILTGQLRDVMQESAQAAMSYVRSRAINLDLSPDFAAKVDIHIHFPGDHIPKDGPSAGITMATSIVSALTRIPVRKDVAMTGEITLRGRVLPIGGLKEKVLAAHRGGIKLVIAPKENRRDLRDIPKRVRKQIEIIFVEHMDEVLLHVLNLEDVEAFKIALLKPLMPPDIRLQKEPTKELLTKPADAASEA
ncbi:MAG: endopeptidase La [Deltaproteobacteria bacterium CG_4_9_14_3_um_filter_63_12]|nr:MAG: endopeptidase La [Deltaproteobacteria bacterium CG17_big_fil_post_rev_8_21_14_2_50_63_7]PJB46573.1 MAG: endopeptidase La [Deltaproteobacteria bacterium CG_4_9_14_3_um_filter_63_12]